MFECNQGTWCSFSWFTLRNASAYCAFVKVNQEVFGSRVVALPDLATPYTVFSQVTAFLAQSAKVPPLPRWLYVGPPLRDGHHLELDSLMIDQVLPTEELTVESIGPLPHGTGREFKDDSQQVHHRRRRHRRRTVSGGVRVPSGETPKGSTRGGSKRCHGWSDDHCSGWDILTNWGRTTKRSRHLQLPTSCSCNLVK